MKKKTILIIIAAVCAVLAILCGVLAVRYHKDATEENRDLEALRDEIKVYQTAESDMAPEKNSEPETAETENVWKTEVPETDVPETAAPATESVETEPTATEIPETEAPAADDSAAAQETEIPETIPPETEPAPETAAPVTQPVNPEATLDFASLQALNPDIHAWIEIDGTKVDYPVLQSPWDDSKYLTTAYDGSYYIGGSIFTQATYNSTDFNDPVTLIYGHTMTSGTLFGQLQQVYSDAESFASHNDVKLSLPDGVRHYTVFAAVPYENIHIMHTYDFSSKYWYENFFNGVAKIRAIGAQFDEDAFPTAGDRVIILSTCLNEDSTRRFLVMAVNRDDLAAHQ